VISPVVIAGCGRSGTSLLLSVLSCHPELYAIAHETLALTESPLRLSGFPTDRRWVEKTPWNVHNLPAILEGLPTARVLNIVRDGRDVITSRHPLDQGGATSPSRTAATVQQSYISIERWIRDVSAGKAMESHERVHTLRYCDLVRDTAYTLERLCDFLDLWLVPELLRYPETASVQMHLAWDGPARPLNADSIGRWRQPEHAADVERFMRKEKAVALLRHYSYL
jgi:hypothetical protein